MANQFVSVQEPSSPTKKMQTFENTVAANLVESEAITLVDSTGVEKATATNPLRIVIQDSIGDTAPQIGGYRSYSQSSQTSNWYFQPSPGKKWELIMGKLLLQTSSTTGTRSITLAMGYGTTGILAISNGYTIDAISTSTVSSSFTSFFGPSNQSGGTNSAQLTYKPFLVTGANGTLLVAGNAATSFSGTSSVPIGIMSFGAGSLLAGDTYTFFLLLEEYDYPLNELA